MSLMTPGSTSGTKLAANAYAEVTEEEVEWATEEEFVKDPEQAAILASLNMARDRRVRE
jgi:hypothetical protein